MVWLMFKYQKHCPLGYSLLWAKTKQTIYSETLFWSPGMRSPTRIFNRGIALYLSFTLNHATNKFDYLQQKHKVTDPLEEEDGNTQLNKMKLSGLLK